MNISILSVFPDLYTPFLNTSLVRRAQEKKIAHFDVSDFFSLVAPKERIDAPTFGHEAGMLLRPDVVEKGIEKHEALYGKAYKIFFSPQGQKLDQKLLKKITQQAQEKKHLMLIPARYEGMDTRVEQVYADEIISVGDFVLMGGDLPAMMLLEGLMRLLPGVVGNTQSVEHDSFYGPFFDHPAYTEPVVWHGIEVPPIIRSGNHAAIKKAQMEIAVANTVQHRFDWIRSCELTPEQKKLTAEHMPNHYVALMHGQVLIGDGTQVGTTSVTSLDIHDIARSCKTYGIKNYFIVTPLLDQQRIVQTLLDFWQTGHGVDYNKHRHESIRQTNLVSDLDSVIAAITQQEGVPPLVVATSAKNSGHDNLISYYDHEKVWQHKRPVLFIFGTGKGLAPEVVQQCDYLLKPVTGFTEFNHLSVRSAVAIILDRWLGINSKP